MINRDRRAFLTTALGAVAAARVAAQAPAAQPQISPVPSTRDYSRLEPIQYPDPDIIALAPAFRRYIVPAFQEEISTARAGAPSRPASSSGRQYSS